MFIFLIVFLLIVNQASAEADIMVKSGLFSKLSSQIINDYHYEDSNIYVSCGDGTIKVFDENSGSLTKLFKFSKKEYGVSDFIVQRSQNRLITNKYIFNLSTTDIIDSIMVDRYIGHLIKYDQNHFFLLVYNIESQTQNIIKYNIETYTSEVLYTSDSTSDKIENFEYVSGKGFYILHEDGRLEMYNEQFEFITQFFDDNLGFEPYLTSNSEYLLFGNMSESVYVLNLDDLSVKYKYDDVSRVRAEFSPDGNFFIIPFNDGGNLKCQVKDLSNNNIDDFSFYIGYGPHIIFKSIDEVIVLQSQHYSYIYSFKEKKEIKRITMFTTDAVMEFQDYKTENNEKLYLIVEGRYAYIRVVIFDVNSNIKYEEFFISQFAIDETNYNNFYPVEITENEILFPIIRDSTFIQDSTFTIARLDKNTFGLKYFGEFQDQIIDLDYDKESNTIALGGKDGILYLYDYSTYNEINKLETTYEIKRIKNTSSKIYFAEGETFIFLSEYDVANDEYTKYQNINGDLSGGYDEGARSVAFSDNGKWAVFYDDGVRLYNIIDHTKVGVYEAPINTPINALKCVDVASDGSILYSRDYYKPILFNANYELPININNYFKLTNENDRLEPRNSIAYFSSDEKSILYKCNDEGIIIEAKLDTSTNSVFKDIIEPKKMKKVVGNRIFDLDFSVITDIKVYNLDGCMISMENEYTYQNNILTLSGLEEGLFVVVVNNTQHFIMLNN